MTKHLEISISKRSSSKPENFSLGPPRDQPEGLAAIAIWLLPTGVSGAHEEIVFRASQIDSCKTANLENVLKDGSLQVGDSIEITLRTSQASKKENGPEDDRTLGVVPPRV